MRKYYIFLFMVTLLAGCQQNRIERTVKRITSHQIILPEKISVAFNRAVSETTANEFDNKMLYVVYVDSASCVSCKIDNLDAYMPLYFLSQSTGRFQLMVLFYTPTRKPELMMGSASRKGYPFPIYFDTNNEFLKRNPVIPADDKYHGFLLNEEHVPILVGDPVSSAFLSLVRDAL